MALKCFYVAILRTIFSLRNRQESYRTIKVLIRKNLHRLDSHMEIVQSVHRRQFKKRFDFAVFNGEVIKAATSEDHSMIAVMDCSFIAKSGKKTNGYDQFYNGSHSRVEKGLEVSLVAVVDVETEVGYGLLAEQTFDQDFCPDLTRMDYYLHHLEITQPQLPPQVRYLALDGAYAKEPFVRGVRALKLDVISKLRRDANLRYVFEGEQKARGAKRKYDGKVDLADPTRLAWVRELQSGV